MTETSITVRTDQDEHDAKRFMICCDLFNWPDATSGFEIVTRRIMDEARLSELDVTVLDIAAVDGGFHGAATARKQFKPHLVA